LKRKRQLSQEVARVTGPEKRLTRIMEEMAKEVTEFKKSKQLKRRLREIDRVHGKKASPVVQGGLPSLGKHK